LPAAQLKNREPDVSNNTNVDNFLAMYSPAVRDLAQQLRILIRRVLPAAIEQVDLPANIICYGTDRSYEGRICGIAPAKDHVSLLFYHGSELADGEHLLEEDRMRARHVNIRSAADIENPALAALLVSAVARRAAKPQ
jgi:hypothetical protein